MDKKFYKKIIDLIPSADLKKAVLSERFEFREKDLLKIIRYYAPTFEQKCRLFREAALFLCEKPMRTLAKKRILFENRQYEMFMQPSRDTVYRIEIKTDTEEMYITENFDDAITLIRGFLRYYRIQGAERRNARYVITKMTTVPPSKPSDFSYKHNKIGELGKCVLDDKLRIVDLEMYGLGREVNCKAGVDCEECDRCIENLFSTHFPHFLEPYALIAYYDDLLYNPKHLTYAVFDSDMEECDCCSHVITLADNAYIQNRNGDFRDENGYYRIYDAHEHPSYFEIIKPRMCDVPQNILDDYVYTVAILKKIDAES